MGVVIKNIVGLRFGSLLVQSIESGKGQKTLYNCLCDCGNTKVTLYTSLVKGNPIKSCGCIVPQARQDYIEKVKTEGLVHGGSTHPLYQGYRGMVSRTTNPNNIGFSKYGGNGRDLCPEWADPITGFWKFVEDMGPKPSPEYSVDRIDNSLGYFPENCRWADKTVQQFNKDNPTRPGVSKSENGKRWRAYISFKRKKYNLGTFDTYEDALSARIEAELFYYGEIWTGQISA